VLFLIDAQLPLSLVAALRDAGCDAVHVDDPGLLNTTDRRIWDEAGSRRATSTHTPEQDETSWPMKKAPTSRRSRSARIAKARAYSGRAR
jgi:hypothetical protein